MEGGGSPGGAVCPPLAGRPSCPSPLQVRAAVPRRAAPPGVLQVGRRRGSAGCRVSAATAHWHLEALQGSATLPAACFPLPAADHRRLPSCHCRCIAMVGPRVQEALIRVRRGCVAWMHGRGRVRCCRRRPPPACSPLTRRAAPGCACPQTMPSLMKSVPHRDPATLVALMREPTYRLLQEDRRIVKSVAKAVEDMVDQAREPRRGMPALAAVPGQPAALPCFPRRPRLLLPARLRPPPPNFRFRLHPCPVCASRPSASPRRTGPRTWPTARRCWRR